MANDSCLICYGAIGRSRIYACPYCRNPFHREHFAAWVFEHESCPVCRNRMSTRVLRELAPKTKSEAEKMLEINREIQKALELARRYDEKFGGKRKKSRTQRKKERIKINWKRDLPPLIIFLAGGVILTILLNVI